MTSARNAQLSNGFWGESVYATALALRVKALASNIPFPLAPSTGHFSGKVLDGATGQPLVGVNITATGQASIST